MTDPTPLSGHTTVEATRVAPNRILVVPVGSIEQHGPHLPVDTDTRIAVELAHRAAVTMPERLLVAPAVCYGASGEHAGFAGTLSIGTDVLSTVLVEIGRSADAFGGLCFVNGHGGNAEALRAACAVLNGEGRHVQQWSWAVPDADAHAGRTETSLMLAIAPEVVRIDAAVAGRREPIVELIDELRSGGVRAVSPNGVLGDPAGASVAEGRDLLVRLVADLTDTIQAWKI